MKVTLRIKRADGSEESAEMPPGTWAIGRETGDIVLSDANVSGRHGELKLSPDGLSFVDLGSTNGSLLNEEKVTTQVRLNEGDVLRLGACTIALTQLQLVEVTSKGTAVMAAQPVIASAPAPQAAVAPVVAPAPVPAADAAPAPAAMLAAESESVAGEKVSAPTSRVRHSYPLAIKDASFMTAAGLLMKTMPYALVRFGILVSISIVSIIWFIITLGGGAFLGSKVTPVAGYAWMVIGLGAYGVLWRMVVRYFMYLLKAGHIAVLTELITKGSVQNGEKGMFEYGKVVVTERFGQVNAMFALDLLIHGVVRAFNRTLNWIASLLPIPGLDSMMSIANKVVYATTTYIDETLFSYSLARGDENIWKCSQEGLIYYAQNCKEILKTGIWIVVLDYVLTAVAWVVMLVPAFVITYLVPENIAGGTGLFTFLIAILFASNIRAAFLKPLFLTMIMVKFHVSAEGQEIDETWDERLTQASGKFQEIKDKAIGYIPKSKTKESKPIAA